LIVGHSRGDSITFGAVGGSYSSKVPLELLGAELDRVSFGEPVEALIGRLGASVRITRTTQRRSKRF
jgi:hypothetical protein